LAAKLLLVWLFALATGFANACVIVSGTYASMGLTERSPAVNGHEAAEHLPGHLNCDDAESLPQHPPSCAKFCADESSSIPAAKHAQDAPSFLDVALVPTMAIAVMAPMGEATAVDSGVPSPPPGPPVSIAYRRLTL